MSQRRILVTSALPYANAPLHLGHMLEAIQADIWCRYQRLRGNLCHYVCADDAHGTAIMLKAEENNLEPEQHIAAIKASHEADFQAFGVAVNNYHSTHSAENQELSNTIFGKLEANGDILVRSVVQAYDESKGLFLADRFIKGTCPRCRATDQYGDNCEACGATYGASELLDARSTLSGEPPVERESEHLFFNLPRFQQFLEEWLRSGALQPVIANKLQEWLESGLKPWDISRDAPYFGFEIPGYPGKYFYVWLDAPIGYMASFANLCERDSSLRFEDYWNIGTKTELYHFIGKDIINFHGLFWPAMLHSAGYRLPTAVFAHGFVTINGAKMSKSRGTFINASHWLQHLPAEPLRYYYATRLGAGVEDIDLNLADFANRINADLVGKLVNIASRCAGFLQRLNLSKTCSQLGNSELFEHIGRASVRIGDFYESRQYSHALREIMTLTDQVNEYISNEQPWTLTKSEETRERGLLVCSDSVQMFLQLITLLKPVVPEMASRVETWIGQELQWSHIEKPRLNHVLQPFAPLMNRIDPKQVDALLGVESQIS